MSSQQLRFSLAPAVISTAAPPIPQAKSWGASYLASPLASARPLLDLSQGVPGTAPHPSVLAALAAVSGTHEAAKYGPILGEPAMRAALAAELRHMYGLKEEGITAEDVGITTGCNMAFLVLLMALCPPGESSILLPLPAYFNHAMSLSLQSVQPAYIACEEGFVPSLASAREILSSAASSSGPVRPRAIVLTTPNNPTGAIYAPESLLEWYALAREFSVALVLDETYRDFNPSPHGLFADKEWRETVVSLGSFSKGYRIPGHRLGSITASPALLQHIATISDCMQICPPRPPQLALAPLLSSLRADLAEAAAALTKRRELFVSVAEKAGWKVISSGGFYAYVEFPYKNKGSEQVAHALAIQCGVLTLPGCFFMPEAKGQDRWIRFAVANVEDETVALVGERLEMMNRIMGE